MFMKRLSIILFILCAVFLGIGVFYVYSGRV